MSQSPYALVFPGQGSQKVGMLSDFADEPLFLQTFEQASDALGYDLWKLVSEGPEQSLNETHRTQPALLTASIALWRLLNKEQALKPAYLAGHSLGEFSALVAAESINFIDAVKLVEKRGELMQKAVPAGVGKMAAILGLDDELVMQACEESEKSEVVSAVNFNSPGQVVIAGNVAAVDRAMALCLEHGAKRAMPLPVSVPSHCALMRPAADDLIEELNKIEVKTPKIIVINNVDVSTQIDPIKIKDSLKRQLYCPVRWTETIEVLKEKGVEQLIECGPGNVLSGLVKRIDRSIITHQIKTKDSINQVVGALS